MLSYRITKCIIISKISKGLVAEYLYNYAVIIYPGVNFKASIILTKLVKENHRTLFIFQSEIR